MEAACQRFEEKGVNWKKRMTDGRMKDIAFVLDPDNYWIEVSHSLNCMVTPIFVALTCRIGIAE